MKDDKQAIAIATIVNICLCIVYDGCFAYNINEVLSLV